MAWQCRRDKAEAFLQAIEAVRCEEGFEVMISADFEEIIPRNTREDKCFYKIIANGVSDIRCHDHAEHDMSVLQLLYNRCLNFVAKAKALSELRLNSLYMV